MAEPLVQRIVSKYNDADVKRYIRDLERIKKLQETTAGGRGGGRGGGGRAENAQARALKELRRTMAEARIEFERLNLANRRGKISNKQFADSVQRMRQRTGQALRGVSAQFKQVPRDVKIALGRAEVSLDRFSTRAQEVVSGRTRLRTRIGQGVRDAFGFGRGVALAGIFALTLGVRRLTRAIVGTGKEFERQMSRVRALSSSTTEQFQRQTDTVRQLGESTVFSATQAAEGMSLLARAGFSVDEQISALPGTLDLAAAGVLDLAAASEITSTVLRGFSLNASEAGRVSDVLAATSTRSNTTVASLGETMKFVAPLAAGLGIEIEEVAAAAGILGDAALKGEKGGTILRALLVRLVDPTKQVRDGLKAANVEILDTDGKMISLTEVIRQLDLGTRSMSRAQRLATLSQIAGLRAVSGLSALVSRGADALQEFREGLDDAGGAARRLADEQLDNLSGDLRLLKSAAEEFALILFDKVKGGLRAAAQGITGFLTSINALTASAGKLAAQYSSTLDEIGRLGKLEKAIDTFEELREKEDRTTLETAAFERAVEDLQRAFPGLVTATKDAEDAVGFYTDRVREAIAAQREFQVVLQQETIQDLASQYEDFSKKAEKTRLAQRLLNMTIEDFPQIGIELNAKTGTITTIADLGEQMEATGETALTFEALTRRTASALVSLFQTTDGIDLDGLTNALVSPSRSLEEATELAQELVQALGDVSEAISDATETEPPPPPPPPPPPGGRARAVERARDALGEMAEKTALVAAVSVKHRETLDEMFKAQKALNKALETQKTLGEDATTIVAGQEIAIKDVVAQNQKRLDQAKEEVQQAEDLGSALSQVVQSLEKVAVLGLDKALGPELLIEIQTRLKDFNEEVIRLRNELSAGAIKDEATFLTAVDEAAEDFLDQLKAIAVLAEKIGGPLAVMVQKALAEAFTAGEAGVKNTDKETKKYIGTLRELTRGVDALRDLLGVFDLLDERLDGLLRGTADVLEGIDRLSRFHATIGTAGGPAAGSLGAIAGLAGPALGIATGIAGFLSGFIRDSGETREELRQLQESLRENAREVSRAVRDFTQAARVGFERPGEEIQDIRAARADFLTFLNTAINFLIPAAREAGAGMQVTQIEEQIHDQFLDFLDQLEDLGIDVEKFREQFLLLLESGVSPADAVQQVLAGLDPVIDSLGDFGDSVDGAVASMGIMQRLLKKDFPEAFLGFLDFLLKNVEGLSERARALLKEAQGLDLSTEEGRKRAKEIGKEFAQAILDKDLGFLKGLSAEDAEKIAEIFLKASEEGAAGAVSGGTAAFQVQHVISDVRANELIRLTRVVAFWTRRTAELLGHRGGAAPTAPGVVSPPPRPPTPAPLRLPDVFFESRTPIARVVSAAGGGVNITIGDLNFNLSVDLDDIDFARAAGEALEMEIRRKQSSPFRMR